MQVSGNSGTDILGRFGGKRRNYPHWQSEEDHRIHHTEEARSCAACPGIGRLHFGADCRGTRLYGLELVHTFEREQFEAGLRTRLLIQDDLPIMEAIGPLSESISTNV